MAISESDYSLSDLSELSDETSIIIEEEEYAADLQLQEDNKLSPYKFEPYREIPAGETQSQTTTTEPDSDNSSTSTALNLDRLANTDW
jgi:hypothetical protein